MKVFTIKRIADIPEQGVFGVIFDEIVPFALTLERNWLNNKSGVSCIPTGDFSCKRIISPKFGETFEVCEVLGRSHILFHKGNINEDSHGCVLIAEKYEYENGKVFVGESKQGFLEFMARLAGQDKFTLVIKNVS